MVGSAHSPAQGLPGQTPPQPGASVATQRWSFNFAKRHGIVALPDKGLAPVRVLHRENVAPLVLAEARRFLGAPVRYECVDEERFQQVLNAAYESDSDTAAQLVEGLLDDEQALVSLAEAIPELTDLLEQEDDAPVIRLINALLTEAVKQNASDIHIETFEKRLGVRFRVDGVLRQSVQLERRLAPLLVSRIKVMAKLDIAEKRTPQDGRISLRVGGRGVDVRVSLIPASEGERIVLRLLDKKADRLELASLGMDAAELTRVRELLRKPHGIILVTGPTGSGKTTTLYAGLSCLNDTTSNIITVEDPIEYNLEGIGQMQINHKTGMTFARGLRAILRQDPDVIMLGEIRDLETAEIAVQASLTGHLVLSTLHTNSAIGAVTRLQDMGVEPFLLSSSLLGVIAQRLVRLLCPHCKQPHQFGRVEQALSGVDSLPDRAFRASACEQCKQTGYLGRSGVFEVVEVDDTLRSLIYDRASEASLAAHARQRFGTLRDSGIRCVLEGRTSLEEALRTTLEE